VVVAEQWRRCSSLPCLAWLLLVAGGDAIERIAFGSPRLLTTRLA